MRMEFFHRHAPDDFGVFQQAPVDPVKNMVRVSVDYEASNDGNVTWWSRCDEMKDVSHDSFFRSTMLSLPLPGTGVAV